MEHTTRNSCKIVDIIILLYIQNVTLCVELFVIWLGIKLTDMTEISCNILWKIIFYLCGATLRIKYSYFYHYISYLVKNKKIISFSDMVIFFFSICIHKHEILIRHYTISIQNITHCRVFCKDHAHVYDIYSIAWCIQQE